jgi:hypothetical protein
MTFQSGRSGNPGGRPKSKPFREALMLEALAAERGEDCFAKKGSLRWNARQLLDRGDPTAIKEIADRLDGKPPQFSTGDSDEFRKAMDLSDDELAAIAAGSGDGAAETETGPSITH